MCDLDFNLMPVFEALYEERRVGRAALRLGVTQSAVSQALGRLRHALNDQLFLRSAQGLVPTARARELAPLVRDVLARWREAARPGHFDPRLSSREFRIVVGSYVGELVLPDIIANLQKASDTVRLRVWNMSSHLGAFLTVFSVWRPQPYEFRVTPDLESGTTPPLWLGASLGLSLSTR